MEQINCIGKVLTALCLLLCVPGTILAETGPVNWWGDGSGQQKMISIAWVHSSDNTGPNTDGIRLGFGQFGRPKSDYPWGEFWLSYREGGGRDVAAAGLSVTHFAFQKGRFGLGPVLDLGVMRRREPGRSVVSGLIGAGLEGVVRIARQWDLVAAGEAIYRTTSDAEYQARFGIRFHR